MRRRKSVRGASATERYRPMIDLLCRRLVRQQVVAFSSGTRHGPVTCNMTLMANRDVGKRVAEHRVRLRDQGLRPLQIWVPDTRAPSSPKRRIVNQLWPLLAVTQVPTRPSWTPSQFNDEDFDT